jgi:hypothetical protein
MGLNITNKKFNKLTAIKFSHKEGKQNRAKWLFKCECGNEKIIDKGKVTGGYTKSCGCLMIEEQKRFVRNATTHGLSGGKKGRRPEYGIWRGIKTRCLKINNIAYKDYGGRGIKICDRWKDSFKNFWEDMGERPSKYHSIDRIDNNKDYEPSNCKWSTPLEQGRNKRNVRLITFKNQTKCLTEWIEFLNLDEKIVAKNLYTKKMNVLSALGLNDK